MKLYHIIWFEYMKKLFLLQYFIVKALCYGIFHSICTHVGPKISNYYKTNFSKFSSSTVRTEILIYYVYNNKIYNIK